MQISSQQLDAFAPAARTRFEKEMFDGLRAFAPQLTRAAGDDALRTVIHTGIDRAEQHGFTHRGPVRFFLELLLSFGYGFDVDPQYAAFQPALHTTEVDQMARAVTLHAAVRRYFDLVSGPDHRHALAAMTRLQAFAASEDLARWENARPERVLALCQEIYPEKYAYVGRPALAKLLAPCFQPPAPRADPLPAAARPVVALLMYGFGAGILSDPMYPWVGQTFRDTAAAPDDLAERLKRRATLYLAEVQTVYRQPA